jgi:hypothetical protein
VKNDADLLVVQAQLEAVRSRAQFLATLAEIRYRIDPRVIAAESFDSALDRAADLIDTTKTSVRSRPLVWLGALATFLVLIGLRSWLPKAKVDSDET